MILKKIIQSSVSLLIAVLLLDNSTIAAFQRIKTSNLILQALPNYKRSNDRRNCKNVNYVSTKEENDNSNYIKHSNLLLKKLSKFGNSISTQWKYSLSDFKVNPWQYLSIPIMAAVVGYVTNWVGVQMLFYPIKWTGIEILRWPRQPFGILGWQGVVPCKRDQMAAKMVDVTINRLVNVQEMFNKLDPSILANILTDSLSKIILAGLVPKAILNSFMKNIAADMIKNIENILDIRSLVIKGMTADPSTLGSFFQRVGNKELKFLVDSGTYCGFVLGLFQMFQWMIFPANWTLPVAGALVGYVTNWIALKWIFEPLDPTKIGPFVFQGLFLTRQKEVSTEFSTYIAKNVLNSQEVWKTILSGDSLKKFRDIIASNAPFLPAANVARIIDTLKNQLTGSSSGSHPIHLYINRRLNLQSTLISRMNKLTSRQFEQVLHPIFQEDELTLILAGGVLGMIAGGFQWWLNIYFDKKRKEKMLLEEANAYMSQNELSIVSLSEPIKIDNLLVTKAVDNEPNNEET